jgi:predicted methyltransferase
MKLNLGCGYEIRKGYVNIDDLSDYNYNAEDLAVVGNAETGEELPINEWIADGTLIVCSANSYVMSLPDQSCDEIYSNRFLGRYDEVSWAEMHRVLKPGGRLVMENAYMSSLDWNFQLHYFIRAEVDVVDRFDELLVNVTLTK